MFREIKQRLKSPTPGFFRKLRNTGIVVTAVSATILTAPVELPAIVIKLASYLAVAGTSFSVASQAAKDCE